MRQDTVSDETAAALRAELERLRHEHARALAEAEARHLKDRLQERAAHIEDLQRALAALTPVPDGAAIPQPAQPFPTAAVPAPAPALTAAEGTGQGSASGKRRHCWQSGPAQGLRNAGLRTAQPASRHCAARDRAEW
ncbi:hypothetical protein ACIF8T_37745 [Streptomyces sp. NPDC085946]|uniref:hypothetical protein n=1 Tax=Streptomyces sp. NPDC085946 TaxID=3365744 RepID=UPI0037D149B8